MTKTTFFLREIASNNLDFFICYFQFLLDFFLRPVSYFLQNIYYEEAKSLKTNEPAYQSICQMQIITFKLQ